jgi:hypothetical protein
MNFRFAWRLVLYVLLALNLSGCATATVARNGRGNVTVVAGGLVESIAFANGITLNIQITREHLPEKGYLGQHILTIGRFSPIIGSGFAKRSNIYYEAPIWAYGEDDFMAGSDMYRIFWRETEIIAGRKHPVSVFSVTLEHVPL